MLPIDRQRQLQSSKEQNDIKRAQYDAEQAKSLTRSQKALQRETLWGGEGSTSSSGPAYEPIITKSEGYLTYQSGAWVFVDEQYSLINHTHDLLYSPITHQHYYSEILNPPQLFDGQWSSILNHPTTINGYGITDAFSGNYLDLYNLPALIDVYGTPTNGQVALWRDENTLEGRDTLVYTGGQLFVNGNLVVTGDITYNNGTTNTPYVLPVASTTVLGGVKVDGSTLIMTGDVISAVVQPQYWTRVATTLSPTTSGDHVEIDGVLYQSGNIDAQDGSLKHITVTAGDASGAAGTDAGDIIIKGGNAIGADAGSVSGNVYLVPGNGYTSGTMGYVYLGNTSFTGSAVTISPVGTASNMNLHLEGKGSSGLVYLGPSGYGGAYVPYKLTCNCDISFTSADREIRGAVGINGHDGYGVTVRGGTGYAGYNGGNLYLYGGPKGAGIADGNVFFGTGSTGYLPTRSSETNVIFYDTTTGKLTYGKPNIVVNAFQTIGFANPLNVDCTTYKDWICSSVTGNTTVNLNNLVDGDSGMIELIIDGTGGYTVSLGTMFTKKIGSTNISNTANADNVISYKKTSSDIIYEIGVVI